MRSLLTTLITLLLTVPVFSVELFRYRGAGKDGGTIEYIFETDEPELPKTITDEKATEIGADFVTTFYHIQIGPLETQEYKTSPIPFWLVCFSDTTKGPIRQMFFAVVLPDGKTIVPRIGLDP
jgi:hypothetical protein